MNVIAIFGPTASGKSAVAEEIAGRIDAELVSADSMQVYRGLPILTNQSDFPTRLVGIWELDHEASVGEYQELAHAAIDEILDAAAARRSSSAGRASIFAPRSPTSIFRRRRRPGDARAAGAALRAASAANGRTRSSPSGTRAAADVVHPNDRRRVVRALELAEAGSFAAPGRGSSLGRRAAPPDAGRRPRASARRAAPPHRGTHARDVRARSGGGGAPRAREARSRNGAPDPRAEEVAELPRDEAIEATHRPHTPLRRLPAQVDATHTGPC